MKKLPIRWKFALWAAALAGVVVAVYSLGTFLNLYKEQIVALDEEIEGEARLLFGLHKKGLDKDETGEVVKLEPWLAFAYFDEAGHLQRHSERLTESVARAALLEQGIHTVNAGKLSWRLGAFSTEAGTFIVAYDLAEVHGTITDLVAAYALSLPVVLLVAAVGGWWVAGRALVPLQELTAAAEGVQPTSLDRRVPVVEAEDELRRLAVVFNAMLGRLEQSFQQAQRFASDASHELRTPLTVMQGEVERLLRMDGLSAEQEEKLVSIQEEIGRLDHITEHLLLLARFDAGKVVRVSETVDFSALANEACDDVELIAAVKNVRITKRIADGVTLVGDAAHLRRLLLNLLQNAAHYNHQSGEVVCTVAQGGEGVRLCVANTGVGIAEELRSRVFERFFRGDPSRTERKGHGLGLSLCKEIVSAHGGEIHLAETVDAAWTEFVVALPRGGATQGER